MTPQEIQIAIAEWRGYKNVMLVNPIGGGRKIWRGQLRGQLDGYEKRVPDYFSSLDAIAEPEGALTWIQKAEFRDYLADILTNEGLTEHDARDASVHATPPQRCEALLRTLNLWHE